MVGRPPDVVPWPARAATTATTGASRTTATSLNRATERIIGVPLYQDCWTAAAGDRICGWPDVYPARPAEAASYSGAGASAHQHCAVYPVRENIRHQRLRGVARSARFRSPDKISPARGDPAAAVLQPHRQGVPSGSFA